MDVAVILSGMPDDVTDTALAMGDIAYDIFLATGVNIEAVPFWQQQWDHPETHVNPRFVAGVRRDGLPL